MRPQSAAFLRLIRSSIAILVAILIGIAAGRIFAPLINSLRSQTEQGDYRSHFNTKDDVEVVLYGTSSCKHCIRARQYLFEKGVKFYDARIDEQPLASEQYERLGFDYVPVIVTRNSIVKGFHARDVDEALRLQRLIR